MPQDLGTDEQRHPRSGDECRASGPCSSLCSLAAITMEHTSPAGLSAESLHGDDFTSMVVDKIFTRHAGSTPRYLYSEASVKYQNASVAGKPRSMVTMRDPRLANIELATESRRTLTLAIHQGLRMLRLIGGTLPWSATSCRHKRVSLLALVPKSSQHTSRFQACVSQSIVFVAHIVYKPPDDGVRFRRKARSLIPVAAVFITRELACSGSSSCVRHMVPSVASWSKTE